MEENNNDGCKLVNDENFNSMLSDLESHVDLAISRLQKKWPIINQNMTTC